MSLSPRNPDLDYVSPEREVYIGLWCLQAGATLFLSARLWAKLTRRHGLWWDDYILITTWVRRCGHALSSGLLADVRVDSPHGQRHHHHYAMGHRLCHPGLGCQDACSH